MQARAGRWRRRAPAGLVRNEAKRSLVLVGILPLAATGFLVWIVVKSVQNAPQSQRWSLIGVVTAGLVLMLAARFVLRSPFFHIRLESAVR